MLGKSEVAPAMERIDSDGYSGVCVASEDWRVIAGPTGNRYWLQRRTPEGLWREVKRRKLPGDLAAVMPPECPLSPDDVRALPDCAEQAAPATVARRAAFNAAFEDTAHTSDAYARILAETDRWRLVVACDASAYVLVERQDVQNVQRASYATATEALNAVHRRVGAAVGSPVVRALWRALDQVPDDPKQGQWAELPKRPESARERRQKAKRQNRGQGPEKPARESDGPETAPY